MHKPLQPALLLTLIGLAARRPTADMVGDVRRPVRCVPRAPVVRRAAHPAHADARAISRCSTPPTRSSVAIEAVPDSGRAHVSAPTRTRRRSAPAAPVIAALHPSQQAATGTACDAIRRERPPGDRRYRRRAQVRRSDRRGSSVAARARRRARARRTRYRPFEPWPASTFEPCCLLGSDAATMKPFALSSLSQLRPGRAAGADERRLGARRYNEVKTLGARAQHAAHAGADRDRAVLGVERAAAVSRLGGRSPADRDVGCRRPRAVPRACWSMAISDARDRRCSTPSTRYGFWRPITAIRNADLDGSDATERDAGWMPLLVYVSLHPEYPCAHCTVGAALRGRPGLAFLGDGELASAGSRMKAADARRPHDGRAKLANALSDFVPEVANARIWSGVHYRNSTEAGMATGERDRPLGRRDAAAPAAGNALIDVGGTRTRARRAGTPASCGRALRAFRLVVARSKRSIRAKKSPPKRGWREPGRRGFRTGGSRRDRSAAMQESNQKPTTEAGRGVSDLPLCRSSGSDTRARFAPRSPARARPSLPDPGTSSRRRYRVRARPRRWRSSRPRTRSGASTCCPWLYVVICVLLRLGVRSGLLAGTGGL